MGRYIKRPVRLLLWMVEDASNLLCETIVLAMSQSEIVANMVPSHFSFYLSRIYRFHLESQVNTQRNQELYFHTYDIAIHYALLGIVRLSNLKRV